MSNIHSDSENRPCPICHLKLGDMLRHLRIQHDIENTEQLAQQVNQVARKKRRQEAFAEYVEELKKKIQSDEITYEEYRRLITKWSKENNE